jgi:hypothetical protein
MPGTAIRSFGRDPRYDDGPVMDPTRHVIVTAATRFLPLATLLLAIVLAGCKGGGSGY